MKGKKLTRADGGKVTEAGGNPEVFADLKRKKGGRVEKEDGAFKGGKAKMRLDRPGRKAGGRVGADKNPLASSHATASPDAEPKSND